MWRTLLTAASVLLVLVVARRAGRRVGGLLAGLPTVTAPALAWLAHDEGAAFAARAAVGSVAACAMLAAFALVHAHAARRVGVIAALLGATLGAAALAGPAAAAGDALWRAAALGLACCALARWAMPADVRTSSASVAADAPSAPALPVLPVALACAGLSVAAAYAGASCGSFGAAVLAAVPVICGPIVALEHARGGHANVARFLRGYVVGLVGRIAFCAAFALAVGPLGWEVACVAGLACAVATGLLMTHAGAAKLPPSGDGRPRELPLRWAFGINDGSERPDGRGHAADGTRARRGSRGVRSHLRAALSRAAPHRA